MNDVDAARGIYTAITRAKNVAVISGVRTDTPYEVKNQNIIDRLEGVEGDARSARFVCAIAAAFPDGEVIVTRGTIEGVIAKEPAGTNGFGYDPIVYVPEYGMTTGQMEPEAKNKISHRGKALEEMKKILLERNLIK